MEDNMEDNKENFQDPLNGIDPIMEDAFSVTEAQNNESNFQEHTESENKNYSSSEKKVSVSEVEFPEISSAFQGKAVETGLFADLPVKVSVELGRSTISLKEIFELSEGSIVELDRLVGEPLDLVVNGQIVAQGEVVAIDNNFGLRIKSIVNQQQT